MSAPVVPQKPTPPTGSHTNPPQGRYLARLALLALGVVYGDIGTSPLYALREAFHRQHGIPVTSGNVLGVLSLIFWSLLLIVTVTRFLRLETTGHGSWLAQSVRDAYKDVTVPVVLRELRERFPNYWNTSWREIATFMIRRFVVRQHEVLAYDKNWDGSRAFFHTENDLIRWRQLNYDEIGVGNARFSRALQILRDLALVQQARGEKKLVLTQDGSQWLKQELAALAQK